MVTGILTFMLMGIVMVLFALSPGLTLLGIALTIGAFYILPGWLVWTLVIGILAVLAYKGVF